MYNFNDVPEIDADYRIRFPHPSRANVEGILGVGGNLSPGVLLSAYEQGIFPWFSPKEPIIWWSPDPRFVLFTDDLHISRRSRRNLLKSHFTVTLDRDFPGVIHRCAEVPREGQEGTWITEEMTAAYIRLHELGCAHSVEVWENGSSALVGGLYGVNRGTIFCGESMFSLRPDASKLALAALTAFLKEKSVLLIDSQVANPHMERLGGTEISRGRYLDILNEGLRNPDIRGWREWKCSPQTILGGN